MRPGPQPLPKDTARALVLAARNVATIKPWNYMSDLHLFGVRDTPQSRPRIISILGAQREVFGVNVYRPTAGTNWILGMATEDDFESAGSGAMLRGLDCCRVEWTEKGELDEIDLQLIADSGVQIAGTGPIYPKFQASTPGWLPWYPAPDDALTLIRDLKKVERFCTLFRDEPDLFNGRRPGEIPIVPEGEGAAHLNELEWLPVVPVPPSAEPLKLTAKEEAVLLALPQRKDLRFECTAQLVPEFKILDKQRQRPYMGLVTMLADTGTGYVFATEVTKPHDPLARSIRKTLIQGLKKAGVRPGHLCVDFHELAHVLQPFCRTMGIELLESPELPATQAALDDLVDHIATLSPEST